MTEDLTTALREVMQRYPDLTIDGLGGDRRPDLEQRRARYSQTPLGLFSYRPCTCIHLDAHALK